SSLRGVVRLLPNAINPLWTPAAWERSGEEAPPAAAASDPRAIAKKMAAPLLHMTRPFSLAFAENQKAEGAGPWARPLDVLRGRFGDFRANRQLLHRRADAADRDQHRRGDRADRCQYGADDEGGVHAVDERLRRTVAQRRSGRDQRAEQGDADRDSRLA